MTKGCIVAVLNGKDRRRIAGQVVEDRTVAVERRAGLARSDVGITVGRVVLIEDLVDLVVRPGAEVHGLGFERVTRVVEHVDKDPNAVVDAVDAAEVGAQVIVFAHEDDPFGLVLHDELIARDAGQGLAEGARDLGGGQVVGPAADQQIAGVRDHRQRAGDTRLGAEDLFEDVLVPNARAGGESE